jgi:putative sigma-54 modulation protein
MQVSVAFRHMEVSDSVQRYASDKLQHILRKVAPGMDIDSQITFWVERHQHIASFTVHVDGLTVKSVEKNDTMYAAIDLALDKVERRLLRFKGRLLRQRVDPRARPADTLHTADAPTDAPDPEAPVH